MAAGTFIRRGGFWVAGQLTLMFAVVALGGIYGQWDAHPGRRWVGVGLLLLAAASGLAGFAALGRNLTAYPKPSEDARLVRHGIYAWVRHPLYVAVISASVGWALVWESGPALAAALALTALLDAKARREERWLRQQFPDYDRYQQEVRRFIPGIY